MSTISVSDWGPRMFDDEAIRRSSLVASVGDAMLALEARMGETA